MKTTQAWGWLAAGVLALGLNGLYHDGGFELAHRALDRAADQSGILADLASERADRFLGRVNLVAARDEAASCRLATAMTRLQNKIARTQTGMGQFEAMSTRQETAMARVEAERARIEAQAVRVQVASAFNSAIVRTMRVPVCPRVRVSVPRSPMVSIPVPAVQVEVSAGGPI